MGECLITRRGGELFKLPVLDANYPENVSLTVIKGNTESASFSVMVAEAGTPAEYTYQWYLNGSAIEGATSSSYVKDDLTVAGIYEFYCEVKNKAGTVTSRVAVLNVTMHDVPVLNSTYPADVTAEVGSSATFKIQIEQHGTPAEYTYQWYVNGSAVSGATSSSYSISNLSKGTYTICCKVTNGAGTVTSRVATLTVDKLYLFKAGDGLQNGFTGFTGTNCTSASCNTDRISIPAIYEFELGREGKQTLNQKIDVTNYSTLTIRGIDGSIHSFGNEGTVTISANAGGAAVTLYSQYFSEGSAQDVTFSRTSLSIDVRNITGMVTFYFYFAFTNDNGIGLNHLYINDIYLS